ncbi:hypothetical protein FRC11_008464 [Ceratobasidium sp. 423]|nr:hypothetical protein FRC11_008464 [Ceratobasidium sp. 423]
MALLNENLSTPPLSPLNELPPDLKHLVLNKLDRKTAQALMRTNNTWFEFARSYVWHRVSGVDALLLLLPFSDPVTVKLAATPNTTQQSEQLVYSLPSELTAEQMERFKFYAKEVRILDVSSNWGFRGLFRGLHPHEIHPPLIPFLEELVVAPKSSLDTQLRSLLRYFCPPSFARFSLVHPVLSQYSMLKPQQERALLSLLVECGFRLKELVLNCCYVPTRADDPPEDGAYYPLLEQLTHASLQAGFLGTLPLSLFGILPHLKYLLLSGYMDPIATRRPVHLRERVLFPSLQHIMFEETGALPVCEVLSGLVQPQLRTIEIRIAEWDNWIGYKEEVLAIMKSVTRHNQTLRVLHFNSPCCRLPEVCIPVICQLRGLTNFRSDSAYISGDDTRALEVFQSWPLIAVLEMPLQVMGLKCLEVLATSCQQLKELAMSFKPSRTQVVYRREDRVVASECGALSDGTLWLRCVVDARYVVALPEELVK